MKSCLPLLFSALCLVTSYAAEPKPLADGAVATDWPRFLGPTHNAISTETRLLKNWEKDEPKLLWEFPKGLGHACPAISGKSLILFHRIDKRETVDCLNAETGEQRWNLSYEAPYQDRYGSGDGPKTNPLIDTDRVFTFGISGLLHCLNLNDGGVVWKRNLGADYQMKPNFFGHGSTPLVMGNRLIVNIGGKGNACVAALDTATGKPLWVAQHEWGASYASPVPATFYGRECVLVFAGGESRPPTGGLLCIDAATGQVLNATPHRARIAESVSASSPVVIGNRVFITESYGSGGEMIEIAPDFSAKSVWKAGKFGAYFMTPVAKDGYLYGSSGQQPRLAELVCYEAATGREMWRDDLGGKFQRSTLLSVDGAFLCLGENGLLGWLDLSPKGARVLVSKPLFSAPESWTLPALSRGLLYLSQNERDDAGNGPRLLCYDLRGQ
ncbi:MAG: Pyrrolo-quinoline quinone [Chthoniobacteraceae bacterium]|nr:Pyrrolo-quinoline quinone [Chthoniobacteraceae bacterium]